MKRIFKKLLSVVLVAVMFLCSLSLAGFLGLKLPNLELFSIKVKAEETATSGTCGENLTWTFDESTGTLTISGAGEMNDDLIATPMPWNSFYSKIKTVVITDGVTSIGSSAFSDCSSLTSITIPECVTSIGELAFAGCTSLTNILIPKNVTTLNYGVFSGCTNLVNITIPEGVTSIGDNAFYECSSLTKITIPSSIKTIGDDAFFFCSNLNDVFYLGNLADWCTITIGSLYSTPAFYAENIYINGTLLEGDIIIPEGITSIGNFAFYRRSNLSSISIPDTVTSIGYFAFSDCSSLTSITIPECVTSIGELAFAGCTSLTNILIPKNVTTLNYGVFGECTSLASITIPEGVTTIGELVFAGCTSLANVTIPKSITYIAENAFLECYSLDKVYFTGTEEEWNSITIEDGNESLINAYSKVISGTYDQNLTWSFDNTTGILTISGEGTMKNLGVTSYTTAPWYEYKEEITAIVIGEGITNIGNYTFMGCKNIETVSLPNSLVKIGQASFYNCVSITDITIPKSVTLIDDYAFYYCNSLVNVYFGGSEEDWGAITVKRSNEALTYATIYFAEHKHSYTSTVTKEANCTEKGIITYTCKCGDSYTEEIAKISHNESEWEIVTEATCTTQGRKTKKCTVCGEITQNEIIPFADHPDKNSDGLCDICDKISNVELVKDIYISIATHENRTINYMESVKLYATTANLPEGYKIKWKVEGDGVEIKPSASGRTCTVTSTSTGNVVVKAYVVDANGNIVTDKNGKQVSDSEYFYSEANLWLRIVYFFKKLFGISMVTDQLFKGAI